MSYKHLTTFKKSRIELLHQQGFSARHHSTISRELNRNTEEYYCAGNAHQKYVSRRNNSNPHRKYSCDLAKSIENALYNTRSPEQISHILTKGIICFKTIYRWIYQGLLAKGNLTILRHKGKRHKPKETRGRFNIGSSISKRPNLFEVRYTVQLLLLHFLDVFFQYFLLCFFPEDIYVL